VQLLRRLKFAGGEIDLRAVVKEAAMDATRLHDIDVTAHVPFNMRRLLDQQAPTMLGVPSGRSTPLTYAEDGSVSASVKLQELFGLAESPLLGPHRVPVTFH